jgi:hypothetical protein
MPTQNPKKELIPLPKTWADKIAERYYRVLERTGSIVLVEVRNQARIHIGYEVALIHSVPVGIFDSPLAPLRETYPPNQAWGHLAWSYGPNQLAAARERVARILAARQEPKTDVAPQIQTKPDGIRLRVLPSIISNNSDIYRQLRRERGVAIFKPARLSTFEVIQIQTGPPHYLDQHKDDYDLVERYPATELWGTAGWSWQSLIIAEAHFSFILKYGWEKTFRGSSEFRAALQCTIGGGQTRQEGP